MLWWLVAFLAVFLIGLTKSGFGSGMALLVVPVMAIAMANIPGRTEAAALGLLLPLLLAGDILALWQYRRLLGMRFIRRLLPGTVMGVAVGGGMLWWFQQQQAEVTAALIRIAIGIESVGMIGLHFWRLWHGRASDEPRVPQPWHSHLAGSSAGISSTVAHAAGPIIMLYLLPQKLDRRLFVGTCAVYFFILNTIKLPAYAASGMFAQVQPLLAALLLPLVLAGAMAGIWLNRRISDATFAKVVYLVTFCLGAYILVDGTIRLWQQW